MLHRTLLAAALALGLGLTACSGTDPAPTSTAAPAPTPTPTATAQAATPVPATATTAPTTTVPSSIPHSVPKTTAPTAGASAGPTARPTAETPRPTSHVTDEPTDQPGPPHDGPGTAAAIAALPEHERACLDPDIQAGRIELNVTAIIGALHARMVSEATGCLSNESIMRLMVLPALEDDAALTPEQSACLAHSNSGGLFRSHLGTGDDYTLYQASLFTAMAALALNAERCLDADTLVAMNIPGTELHRLRCIVSTPEQAAALHARTLDLGPSALDQAIDDAATCLASHPPQPLVEPLPNCTQEEIDAGLPCMIHK